MAAATSNQASNFCSAAALPCSIVPKRSLLRISTSSNRPPLPQRILPFPHAHTPHARTHRLSSAANHRCKRQSRVSSAPGVLLVCERFELAGSEVRCLGLADCAWQCQLAKCESIDCLGGRQQRHPTTAAATAGACGCHRASPPTHSATDASVVMQGTHRSLGQLT